MQGKSGVFQVDISFLATTAYYYNRQISDILPKNRTEKLLFLPVEG
jgi:hypothetical protein